MSMNHVRIENIKAVSQWAFLGRGGEEEGIYTTQEEDPGSIVALIDNRAREVGFASFNPVALTLSLCQYIESGSSAAATTSMLLKLHDAREAVLLASHNPTATAPDAASQENLRAGRGASAATPTPNSPVLQASPYMPELRHYLPRSAFDDTKGLLTIQTCAVKESWDRLSRATAAGGGNAGFYLACGAAGALLQHLMEGAHVLANTVTVELIGTSAHVTLDAGSIESLEILPHPMTGAGIGAGTALKASSHQRPGGPAAGATNFRRHVAHQSLLHHMNHTRTGTGQRFLRASLLQPLTSPEALSMRYDCVEELLDKQDMVINIGKVLSVMPRDIDKTCCRLVILPPKPRAAGNVHADPTARIGAMVSALLLLRATLKVLPMLGQSLEGAESRLLRAVHRTCQQQTLPEMLDKIDKIVDTDAQLTTSPLLNRVQQCFAVKAGADEFLDVARSSFCRITDKVHKLAEGYRQEVMELHGGYGGAGLRSKKSKTSDLKVQYSNRRGFYMCAPLPSDSQGNTLSLPFPRAFLPLEKRGRSSLLFTTHELNALNARLRDAAYDCLVLTEKVLEELVACLSTQLPLILRVADNVAMLDMMLAFAEAARRGSYTRPQIHTKGQLLAIVQGRHPLLEGNPEEPFQPNDTYVDADCASLHIITGPNMAGKSTYLKQVALLVVMAQAGSFVPAEFMALCPFSSLFTRMGTGDSIEMNSSSFMLECQEVAHILDHACGSSLVIVDELGRATSTSDGVALAWSVCEAMLAARTPCLFATHFVQLADLAALYPAAKLWNLQVDISHECMDYTWQLSSTATLHHVHYGIALARSVGFPHEVLEVATSIAEQVNKVKDDRQRASGAAGHEHKATWDAVYAATSKLVALARQCNSTASLGLPPDEQAQQHPDQHEQQPCQQPKQASSHVSAQPQSGPGNFSRSALMSHPFAQGNANVDAQDVGRGQTQRHAAWGGVGQDETLQLSVQKARQGHQQPAEGQDGSHGQQIDGQAGPLDEVTLLREPEDVEDQMPIGMGVMTDVEAHQFAVHLQQLQLDVVQQEELLGPGKLDALMRANELNK